MEPEQETPKEGTRLFLDGGQWCATYTDFVDLMESPAGFGLTPNEAYAALAACTPKAL